MQTTSSGMAIAPGAVVAGRYALRGLLGQGGMADVYDAVDERLDRPVAVKVLRPELVAREDVRFRFHAEARAAAGLSHPNAVAVYDTGEHDGAPFLVMERLPGETLADRIAAGPVSDAWLRTAARGILGALAQAHGAGIVHRDVKPGNILIAADGTAKIADFGIAKSIPREETDGRGRADLTMTGQLLGTPAYLAPERLEGSPASPAADLWALGVVLYEALAGTKAFVGRSQLEVAQAIVTGSCMPLATLRPDLDRGLLTAVERAMAREPGDRFASADEMAEALRGAPLEPTVDQGASDGTMVLPTIERPRPPVGAATTAPRRPARPAGRRPVRAPLPAAGPIRVARFSNWPRLAYLAMVALVLVLFLVARAGESDRSGVVAGASTEQAEPASTTQATTAAQGLAAALRDLASRLDIPNDGARAEDLGAALRDLARDVESGAPGQGAKATGLVVTVVAWAQTGQLNSVGTTQALELLGQVPGVDSRAQSVAATSGGSSGQTSATAASTGNGKGKANGKNKDEDDD